MGLGLMLVIPDILEDANSIHTVTEWWGRVRHAERTQWA